MIRRWIWLLLVSSWALAQVSGNGVTGGASGPLLGTSGSIGGGALAAGACASGTVTISGLATSMDVHATPVTYPGDGNVWYAYASATNTATVKICAIVADTPTASIYNIRVLP